jgi:acyl-CoA thioester hydrolase
MHQCKLRVRLSETDCLKIVYYANYFVYFDVARIELLREAGINQREMEKKGLVFLCAEASCKYLLPLEFDEQITIKTWIERIGKTSITYRHLILKEDGREAAEGYVKDVLANNERKPLEIPEEWRTALSKYIKG